MNEFSEKITWYNTSFKQPEAGKEVLIRYSNNKGDIIVSLGQKDNNNIDSNKYLDTTITDRDGDFYDIYNVEYWAPMPIGFGFPTIEYDIFWFCKRCQTRVDMQMRRCNCKESPSPWELRDTNGRILDIL